MSASAKVTALLRVLEESFPTFRPTATTAAVWSEVLDSYTAAELQRAAVLLAKHHRFGAPSTAHVVEAIEGRLVSVPIQATDCWGSKRIRASGEPIIERWEERRLPYGEVLPEGAKLGVGSVPLLGEGE